MMEYLWLCLFLLIMYVLFVARENEYRWNCIVKKFCLFEKFEGGWVVIRRRDQTWPYDLWLVTYPVKGGPHALATGWHLYRTASPHRLILTKMLECYRIEIVSNL